MKFAALYSSMLTTLTAAASLSIAVLLMVTSVAALA